MDPQTDPTTPTDLPPGASAPGGQDVMRVLAEFETGLESLKSLYAQRQALQAEVESRRNAVESQEQALRAREASLAELAAALEEKERQHAKVRGELEEDRQDFEEEATRRLGEIEGKRQEVEASRGSLAEQGEALAARWEELSRREEGISAQREAVQNELRGLEQVRSQLAAREADLVRRDGAIRQLQGEIEGLRSTVEAGENRGREMGEREASLAREIEARVGEAAGLTRELDEVRARLAAAEGQLREREGELSGERTRAESGTAAMDSMRGEIERLTGEVASQKNESHELEIVIEALRERLRSEIKSREDIGRRLEAAQAERSTPAATPREAGWIDRRKARLGRYRAAIAERGQKLRKAGDALAKRFEQCEQLLSMRADLYQARERIVEAEKRLAGRRGGSHAATIVLSAAVTMGIIATLSWAISRQIVPAMYEATSVIAADGRGRELNEAEIEEWGRFHEQLLKDPVFHSAASERFQRQGVEEYAAPAGVARLVSRGLRTEMLESGTMTLRLAAPGAPRAERDLDILTAALASQANAAQQRRIDGGVTKVEQSAKAGEQPIDNTQNLWAIGMAGAGNVLAGIVGLILWRRLARVKSDFEADTLVTRTLDPARVANFKKTG